MSRAWNFIRHLVRNALGLVPLFSLLALGVVVSVPLMLVSPDGLGMRFSNAAYRFWARWTLRTFGVRVFARGLENMRPDGRYILAITHRSHIDVPVLGTVVTMPLCSVHKKSLEYVPVLGQSLKLARGIAIDRNDAAGSRRRLTEIGHRLSTGRSVVMFPEGTRSMGPALGSLKKGAVVVAIEQQCELLPITMIGTDAAYPPDTLMMNKGDVVVVVHPPIPTVGLTQKDRDSLNDKLRSVLLGPFTPGPPSAEQVAACVRRV